MYLSYHLRITISLLRTYHPTLEPEHLRQEGVRQRPHVGPLLVVRGAADNKQRAYMWALTYAFLAEVLGL